MKRIFICFFFLYLLFCFQTLEAQTDTIVLKGQKGSIYAQTVKHEFMYFFVSSTLYSKFYRLNLDTETFELLDSNIYYSSTQFSDSGVYYVALKFYPNGSKEFSYLKYNAYSNVNTTIKNLDSLLDFSQISNVNAFIKNNKYYVRGNANNKNFIIENSGVNNKSKLIYNNSLNPESFTVFKDKFYGISRINNKFALINSNGDVLHALVTSFVHQNDSSILFYKNKKLCVTSDFLSIDSVSFANYTIKTGDILVDEDSLIHGVYRNTADRYQSFKLRLTKPYAFDSFPASLAFQKLGYADIITEGADVRIAGKSNILQFWSALTGFEILIAKKDDSIRIVKDLNPGFNSSTPYYFEKQRYHYQDGIFYFVASNGGDSKSYLHSSNGKDIQCYFPFQINNTTEFRFKYNERYYWTGYNKDSLFFYHRSLNDRDTQFNPGQVRPSKSSEDEWHRMVAGLFKNQSYGATSDDITCTDLKVDKSGNTVVLALSGLLTDVLRFSDTVGSVERKGNHWLIKYDPYGRVVWAKTFGHSRQNLIQFKPTFTFDANGDIFVFSYFFQSATFDSLVLTTPRNLMFVAKIEAKTGRFKWVKTFNPKQYANYFTCDGIACDKDDNIYLSLMYQENVAEFDKIKLYSKLSTCNAIAKMNTNGNFIWAKNVTTPWTDRYGLCRSFFYDEKENKLYNLISQGYYNWRASCQSSTFRNVLQQINTDGVVLRNEEIVGDDLNAAICAIPTDAQSVFVSGFYRSELTSKNFTIHSQADSKTGCYWYQPFTSTLSTYNLYSNGLHTSEFNSFYPLDIAKDDAFIYVLGSEYNPTLKGYNLSVRKYTHLGKPIAKRYLTWSGDPFQFNYFFSFDVSGDYIYLGMQSIYRIQPFYNFIYNASGLSVYKLYKDKDWITESSFEDKQVDAGIVVAPNPAYNLINIQFLKEVEYSNLQLIDALGRTVLDINLSEETYQTIRLDKVASGFYTLILQGAGKTYTQKLIVN